jgi:hypothetical protein
MQAAAKISKLWTGSPGWIYIGIAVILMPIFTILTVENIHRQQENTVRLLVEEGAALIRSFEAGTRTGMMGRMMGGFKLQHLLTETAQQPDIVYLMVTDGDGTIIAHSDLGQVGKVYDRNLDFDQIARDPDVQWRRVRMEDGRQVFEVYRRFDLAPLGIAHGTARPHDTKRLAATNGSVTARVYFRGARQRIDSQRPTGRHLAHDRDGRHSAPCLRFRYFASVHGPRISDHARITCQDQGLFGQRRGKHADRTHRPR